MLRFYEDSDFYVKHLLCQPYISRWFEKKYPDLYKQMGKNYDYLTARKVITEYFEDHMKQIISQDIKLKPCPFCGASPQSLFYVKAVVVENNRDGGVACEIRCPHCDNVSQSELAGMIYVHIDSLSELMSRVAEQWNKRIENA